MPTVAVAADIPQHQRARYSARRSGERRLSGPPERARDQIGRIVPRSYRPGWVSIAAAVPPGCAPAGGAARWLDQVDQHQAVTALRADSRRTVLAIVGRLAARCDRRTGTVTITWQQLQQAAGVGRSTVAVWLSWLRRHQLLATVHGGATSPAGGNTAPCYLPVLAQQAAAPPVDQHRTPSVDPLVKKEHPPRASQSTAGLPAGGRRSALQRPRLAYTTDRLPPPHSRKHPRYALAAALAAARPLLFGPGRARLSAVAHALAPATAAGWTLADVLAVLDGPGARPVPTGPDETSAVRHPARWLAHRIAGADQAERPTHAADRARAAAAAAHRAEVNRLHAHLNAMPGRRPMPDALRAELDVLRRGHDRARRRRAAETSS